MRYVAMVVAGMSGQGPPIVWTEMHSQHHRHCEKEADPHSPHHVRGGLWSKVAFTHGGYMVAHDMEGFPPRSDLRGDTMLNLLNAGYPLWEMLLFAVLRWACVQDSFTSSFRPTAPRFWPRDTATGARVMLCFPWRRHPPSESSQEPREHFRLVAPRGASFSGAGGRRSHTVTAPAPLYSHHPEHAAPTSCPCPSMC